MLTKDVIMRRLTTANQAIQDGTFEGSPHHFVEELWAQIHEEAPEAMQAEVFARLMDFTARLGLLSPGHHEGPWPEVFRYRPTRARLSKRLDELDGQVPRLKEAYPERGDLLEGFAAHADCILDEAEADQRAFVHERLDWIIAKHRLETP